MPQEPIRLRQVLFSYLLSRDNDPNFGCPQCEAIAKASIWAIFYRETATPDAMLTIRCCSYDAGHPEPQPKALIERLSALYAVPSVSVLATRGALRGGAGVQHQRRTCATDGA